MADAKMREMVARMPVPEYSHTPFVTPPPLEGSRVAIVTTAGLMRHGAARPWAMGDAGFRAFDRRERDLIVGHVSSNFDRSGISSDLNVAYPVDRLEELALQAVIGGVAPRHLSFMGALPELSTLQMDTGPAAAKLLRDDGVDVALLVPV
jgi:D-proline reductase (dithiol) PrdB